MATAPPRDDGGSACREGNGRDACNSARFHSEPCLVCAVWHAWHGSNCNPHPSPVHRSTTTTIRENEASLGRVGARRDPSSLSHHSGRPDTSPSPRLCRKKATAIRAIPARSSAGPGPFPSRPRSSRAEEKEQASGVEGATRAGAAAVR